MRINGIAISDVHFGALKAPVLFNELNQCFFREIISVGEKLDVVFIAGDLFDKKLSFNEEHARYAIKFMNKLVALSKKYGFKIRIIKGTRNHDLHQLNNFQYNEREDIDFKVINTVSEEDMFGDEFKILYLPEEYMEDMEEFYKDTLYNDEKKYDLIVGHGSIEFQSFEALNQESERKIANAPTFKNNLLTEKANLTIFGHIHNRCNYKEKLYYCGSFSRWIFGEEKPKGFIKFTYNTDDKDYNVEYIDNKLAKEFKTINVDEIIKDETLKIEDKINILKNLKEKESDSVVKFKYTTEDNNEDNQIIKNFFAESSDVVISARKERIRHDENEKKLIEEYGFIFNKEYSLSETISKFLEKKGKSISAQRVEELLNKED